MTMRRRFPGQSSLKKVRARFQAWLADVLVAIAKRLCRRNVKIHVLQGKDEWYFTGPNASIGLSGAWYPRLCVAADGDGFVLFDGVKHTHIHVVSPAGRLDILWSPVLTPIAYAAAEAREKELRRLQGCPGGGELARRSL